MNDRKETRGVVPTLIGHKRKTSYRFDENNVYMADSIRRRSLLGDDSDTIDTDSDESSSDSDSSGDEDIEKQRAKRARKRRERKNRKRRLHWSKSPDEESKYSDWNIEVRYFATTAAPLTQSDTTNKGDDGKAMSAADDKILFEPPPTKTEVETYSVHRSILGVQSEYFERIFLGGYAESAQKKNTIELPSPLLTPAHFENILEFCYTETVKLDSMNVVSIIHLSDYLGIEELRKQAQEFVRGGIHQVINRKGGRFLGSSKVKVAAVSSKESKEKSENVATYYQAATALGMDDLQRAIVHVCSKEPELLVKDCPLTDMPDLEFWSRLWEARNLHPDQISLSKACVRLWSENLAHFFDKHPGIVDLETFRKLTHIEFLRVVSPEVALLLMQQENKLCEDEIKTNIYLVNKDDKEESLTCLQSRCIDAMYNTKSGGWQISSPPDVIRGKLRRLPSIVLESILLKTLEYEKVGQCFPTLVVHGAGSDFINGEFKMSGWFKNAMKFTRWGIYDGNPREITLYRYEGEWWISIIPEHRDEPGDCDDIDFYSFDKLDDDNSDWPLPPTTNGWTTCTGEAPAPRIRLATEVGDIDGTVS
jgi:hypothetical protein